MSDIPTQRTGRYAGIPAATYIGANQRPIVYLTRRFVPRPEQLVQVQEHVVHAGERLDHVAARYLGDPELFWRICDANRATDPVLLTTPGQRLRITLPAEMSWGGSGGYNA